MRFEDFETLTKSNQDLKVKLSTKKKKIRKLKKEIYTLELAFKTLDAIHTTGRDTDKD
tara:strand:- start:54 stop:227 length:174 start_codon:yes stop_codon:yes gene_type:complete